MTDGGIVRIASAALEVEVATLGAELQRIRDAQGRDWLWDGDPAFWTGRAPLLFPIVGALAGGIARIGDREYRLEKHGFARRSRFEVTARDDSSVTLRLEASPETRAAYPFAFRLDVTHRLDGATLTTVATVLNPGEAPLPASFGFHPALRWPVPGGDAKTAHVVRFDAPEPSPLRAVDADGLIPPGPAPTPIEGRTLRLDDRLFAHDALVWDRIESRGLWFGVPGSAGVRVDFPGMPMLGIWMKPGAGYLCIEPWQGHADPSGYAGAFADKPGMVTITPGECRSFEMAMTFGVAA